MAMSPVAIFENVLSSVNNGLMSPLEIKKRSCHLVECNGQRTQYCFFLLRKFISVKICSLRIDCTVMGDWNTKTAISLVLRVGHAYVVYYKSQIKGKVHLKNIFTLLFFDPRFLA